LIIRAYSTNLDISSAHMISKKMVPNINVLSVNTKNWYRKGTDLWAEFGNEMPFRRKNLLRGFGKDACGRQYAIIRQKDCLRFKEDVFGNA
jgi:hypothetical protein